MKAALALALLLVLGGCARPPAGVPGGGLMKLKVDGFKAGDPIPSQYTCDGADERPDFSWSDAPEGTKSFAISVLDYDVPKNARSDGEWSHWLVKDLPADVREIKGAAFLPAGAKEVVNDFGRASWGGPCPPDRKHDYHFRVYALKTAKLGEVDEDDFHAKASAQSLAIAEVVAGYERKR